MISIDDIPRATYLFSFGKRLALGINSGSDLRSSLYSSVNHAVIYFVTFQGPDRLM